MHFSSGIGPYSAVIFAAGSPIASPLVVRQPGGDQSV